MNTDDYDVSLYSSSTLADSAAGDRSVLGRVIDFGFDVFLKAADVASGGVAGSLLPQGPLGDQESLLRLQLQIQREMQQVTMRSNIHKARHEARMAAVRNMKP